MPMTLNEPWRVTLLGGLSARQAGPKHHPLPRPEVRRLAGLYLAYHRKQAHPREVLVELFWPELDERFGRNNLSMALSSLRHQLEPPGVPCGQRAARGPFQRRAQPRGRHHGRGRVRGGRSGSRQGGQQRRAGRSPFPRRRPVRGAPAARLLRGVDPRERSAWRACSSTRSVSSLPSGAGRRPARRAHPRSHAVSVDPLREEGQQHLVRLLAAMGQSGAALRQYKEFERLLDEELGDEPRRRCARSPAAFEREAGLAAPPLPVAAAVAARPSPLRSSEQSPPLRARATPDLPADRHRGQHAAVGAGGRGIWAGFGATPCPAARAVRPARRAGGQRSGRFVRGRLP
jgi:hypothetical protein